MEGNMEREQTTKILLNEITTYYEITYDKAISIYEKSDNWDNFWKEIETYPMKSNN